MINPLAIALPKAALIYDEWGCRGKLKSLGIEYLTWDPFESGTDFFVVARTHDGYTDILFRGTDGLQAWLSNLNMTLDEGKRYHRDFYNAAITAYGQMDDYYKFDSFSSNETMMKKVRMFCHSRATAISPHLAIRLCDELLYKPLSIELYNFAVAPTFTNRGITQIWNPAHEEYDISGFNVINSRDALCGERFGPVKLRGTGEDEGADTSLMRIELPPDSWYQRWMKKLFPKFDSLPEHSPREYVDGLMAMPGCNRETKEFLKKARKLFVN